MTAPTPTPQPDPAAVVAVAGGFVERMFSALDRLSKTHHVAVATVAFLVIMLCWLGITHITEIHQHHADVAALAPMAADDKVQLAQAKFWKSEATKRETVAVHDTVHEMQIVMGATRFVSTPAGMVIVRPDSAPPVPLGEAVPLQYVTADRFDSLAAQCTLTHRDFSSATAASDSESFHAHSACDDVKHERDTALKRLTASEHRILKAELKAGAIGAAIGIVIDAVLHH
jgi:hypothetical protein